tara:strand:+ start:147 stop:635 length:489 start_codon:yes stop_codon:yes gene_type:complete
MSIVEIGALAQLVGAIAILLSLVFVVIELRKNFRQNDIANTLQRNIEREKVHYAQMQEGLAKLLVKAYRSYNELKDFEQIQFEGYVLQRFAIAIRAYRTADETAFKTGVDYLRRRVRNDMTILFSHPGVHECYQALKDRDAINSHEVLLTIIAEDVLARPAG